MGTSTDAVLFYGIHADENEWEDFIGEDWQETLASKFGVHEPQVPYETPEQEMLFHDYWDKKDEICEKESCAIDFHCSGEYPMPYAFVRASKTEACRGYPEEISGLTVQPEWDQELKGFCELMGIPWTQPKWWLVSYWG